MRRPAEQLAAAAVATGFEFSIPLSVLGNPTDDIDVVAFISGGNFLSNQVSGDGANGVDNLGTASGVNFDTIGGDQFVTVAIPEPATLRPALRRRPRPAASAQVTPSPTHTPGRPS